MTESPSEEEVEAVARAYHEQWRVEWLARGYPAQDVLLWEVLPPVAREPTMRCARAAILAYQQTQWKDISGAPKDGTDFVALIPWNKKHHQMVGCIAPNGQFRSWPGRLKYEPTHWQPLPPPPEGLKTP